MSTQTFWGAWNGPLLSDQADPAGATSLQLVVCLGVRFRNQKWPGFTAKIRWNGQGCRERVPETRGFARFARICERCEISGPGVLSQLGASGQRSKIHHQIDEGWTPFIGCQSGSVSVNCPPRR